MRRVKILFENEDVEGAGFYKVFINDYLEVMGDFRQGVQKLAIIGNRERVSDRHERKIA